MNKVLFLVAENHLWFVQQTSLALETICKDKLGKKKGFLIVF